MLSVLTILTGLVIYANFWMSDPMTCGEIGKPDQLLPFFVIRKLSSYPGVPGLVIAGIFSGSLSTVSSFVNSLSAVTLEDYLKPIVFKRCPSLRSHEILITKLLASFYGLLCIALTVVADQMAGMLQASLTVFGVVGGPLLMLFTAGMCTRVANSSGTLIGFLVSLAFGFWIGFGGLLYGHRPERLPTNGELCMVATNQTNYFTSSKPFEPSTFFFYNISYVWYAGFSWALGMLVTLAASWLTQPKAAERVEMELNAIRRENGPGKQAEASLLITLLNK